MSLFAQLLALLPAIAAMVVIVVALADRRDATRLDDLRALDGDLDVLAPGRHDLESSAA